MPRKKSVTLRQLANRLNLSVHTVSKALRGLPGMSEETRYEVIQTAAKMGYKTKDQQQSLLNQNIPVFPIKQRRFTLILAEKPENQFHINQMILQGLQERLAELGHTIETLILPSGIISHRTFDQWAEKHNLLYTDGLILTPAIPFFIENKLLELNNSKVMVNFPPSPSKVDSVIWDVYNAVFLSIRHFISKGHEKILYIGDIHSQRGYKLRWQAFNDAMKEVGIEVNASEHVTEKYINKEEWVSRFLQQLQQFQPTALLCTLNQDLVWVYYACSRINMGIPENYSFISLAQDDFIPEVTRPILLIKEAGYRAADLMLWRIANPHLPYEHIRLQGSFYEGRSVKSVNADNETF